MGSILTARRAGMSLVELLVVVAILGLLAVTVLPAISSTSEGRRAREAARLVSSYVAKSQARALGKAEWSGFWLMPPGANSTATFALDLFLADVPSMFRGDLLSTTVSGTVSVTNLGVTFDIKPGSFNGISVICAAGDLVRFDGQSPWYSLLNPTSVRLRDGSLRDGSRSENVNQTLDNTPWPAENVPHTFEVLRRPILAGSPITIADGRCVDLYWSAGDSTAASYVPRVAAAGPIALLFDGTGRLRQLFYGTARYPVMGAVYLLIGRTDRAGKPPAALDNADDSVGANWQYSDSYWIAIDPMTGIARTAECARQAGLATDNVFASQAFIRSEFSSGGR